MSAVPMNHFLVLVAVGGDQPGLVNELTQTILDCGGNIADSRMAVLGGEFAVLILLSGQWNAIAKLEQSLPRLEQKLGLTLILRRTKERNLSKQLLPYAVEVVALDHPGIVHQLASFFAQRGINIEELATSSYAAAHTGTPMFSVRLSVAVPADLHIASLRDEFMDFCDRQNLDAVMEPIRG